MYRKILIATDGSELAGNAVDQGLRLASSLNAQVVILTVTEVWSALDMASEAEQGNTDAIKTFERSASRAAEAILQAAAEMAKAMGLGHETHHLKDRKPAEGILELAELEDCDLIVMASHGRRGLRKILIGSQTAGVIAMSKRPVLVVR